MSKTFLPLGTPSVGSSQIKSEILRFESVHPSIYEIYDILNAMPDSIEPLKSQLREQVVAVEDAFVNSQEWTISRSVHEIRVGVVGAANSGKTSLVHRYLTGTYSSDENFEGGRFKKEIIIDGHSSLLLIRDEGYSRELDVQFCQWVDAVIFVFSVTSEDSFDSIRGLVTDVSRHRNITDLPFYLEMVSEKRARVISEDEGRQLAMQLKKCQYYETSATFGTNVERVFKDAVTKILNQRYKATARQQRESHDNRFMTSTSVFSQRPHSSAQPLPPAPPGSSSSGSTAAIFQAPSSALRKGKSTALYERGERLADSLTGAHYRGGSERSMSALLGMPPNNPHNPYQQQQHHHHQPYPSYHQPPPPMPPQHHHFQHPTHSYSRANGGAISPSSSQKSSNSISNGIHSRSSAALCFDIEPMTDYGSLCPSTVSQGGGLGQGAVSASTSHLPTPSSTPNTQRKNRRISNIFQRPKDSNSEEKTKAIEALNLGVGRAIPVKQGILYKRSTKSALNRDWKKKYVCLYSDGRLAYHQNLKEYMDKSAHGKEVFLGLATVRVAGRQRPRNTQRASQIVGSSASGTPTLQSYDRKSDFGAVAIGEGTSGGEDGLKENQMLPDQSMINTSGSKKKREQPHKRLGSGHKNNEEDDECFEVVTHNQQRWEFCASSAEERDEWVHAIEEQIELALTAQTSQPTSRVTGNRHQVQALRQLPGNDICADCGQQNPDWASMNLGTLICIECSGIHRNLGSHISRVRSLELDDWPLEFLAVMQSIGNDQANRVWEGNLKPEHVKPSPDSSRETKETWIRQKYEQKLFLAPLLKVDEPLGSQLINAVIGRDVPKVTLLLAKMEPNQVNYTVSSKDKRTPLHLACSIGSMEIVQLLLWNNADMKALDEQSRSCLWYAQNNGFMECSEMLVSAGLPSDFGIPVTERRPYSQIEQSVYSQESLNESAQNRDYSCLGDEVMLRRKPTRTDQSID